MSQNVLTGALLDFGKSFWGSPLLRREFPGMATTAYRATGRYGIGFFSVFMLGSQVQVRSRRFDLAATDTNVLEFRSGLDERPILRQALQSERLTTGGTLVRIRLDAHPSSFDGLFSGARLGGANLRHLVTWLAPASPVDIRVADAGDASTQTVIVGDDWKTLKPDELYERLYGGPFQGWADRPTSSREDFCDRLRDLAVDGQVAGRLAMAVPDEQSRLRHRAVITVGGLRAASVSSVMGVLRGQPHRAARDAAYPDVPDEVAQDWACRQASLLPDETRSPLHRVARAQLLGHFCAPITELPLCITAEGALTCDELADWAKSRSSVVLDLPSVVTIGCGEDGTLRTFVQRAPAKLDPVELSDNVVLVESSPVWVEAGFNRYRDSGLIWPRFQVEALEGVPHDRQRWWSYWSRTAVGWVVAAVAQGWGTDVARVIAEAKPGEPYQRDTVIATHTGGGEVKTDPILTLVPPKAP